MVSTPSIQRVSRLFQPSSAISKNVQIENKEVLSKSQKLLTELGFIKSASNGHFYYLPLGMRIVDKLNAVVEKAMASISAQKVAFPLLINSKLWKKSGRLNDDLSNELFKICDRHKSTYVLSPTHEEAAADLLSSISQISYKQFPLRLYQISSKFRDEMKPRFGLIRSREFLMKDLYSFDVDIEQAKKSYGEICQSYDQIFQQIGVSFVKVVGSSGNMGGSLSHEYHYVAPIGEDKLLSCSKCGYKANVQVSGRDKCYQCGGNNNHLSLLTGLEVGHTFLLGDKYSVPLKALYKSDNDQMLPIQMGSYGLGLSRIIASAVEVMSTEHEIRWPNILAPFKIIVIPPKTGSKEEKNAKDALNNVTTLLNNSSFQDEILIDDRTNLTVGRRCLDAKRVGYPFIIIIGTKILEEPPLYEIIDIKNNLTSFLSRDGLLDFFYNFKVESKVVAL